MATPFRCGGVASNITKVPAGVACGGPPGPRAPISTLVGIHPVLLRPSREKRVGPLNFTGVPWDPFQPWLGSLQFLHESPQGKRAAVSQFLQGYPRTPFSPLQFLQGSLWGPLSAMERYPPTSQGSPRGKRVGSPRFYRGPQGPFSALAGFPPVFTGGPHGGSV